MRNLSLLLLVPVRLEQVLESARKTAPSLIAMRQRGVALDSCPSLAGICCQAFGVAKQRDWPIAPLTARLDGLEPGKAFWLRLDPCHLEVGLGGLMLHPAAELGLTGAESQALVASINEYWRKQGLEILAPTPTRWYLSQPAPPDVSSTPLDQVSGEYLTTHLPRGRDANRLMALVNEAQMVMHGHSVNLDREAGGLPVVNGLWLWGGGVLPATAPSVDRVASDYAEARVIAMAAGLSPAPSPARLADLEEAARASNILITLSPGLDDFSLNDYLAKLERDWFRPLLRDLRFGRTRRVHLHLLARPGQSFTIDTAGAWRFWR